MKVAVTGASGFVGRHVLKELLKHGVEITAVTRDATRLTELSSFIGVVEMDISQPLSNSYERMGYPDILIHLAWDGLPNYRSLHHFETELPIQYKFLKGLINAGLPSLLVTGTCFEYGMQSGALAEDMLTKPDNPYGFAKDALRKELGFLKLVKPYNLTWARLFYIYGEGQASSSLYPKMKDAVAQGDRVFKMSGGEQLRDYLPVAEVARDIVRLALAKSDLGAVNVCSGKPISVRNLVEKWKKENGWQIEFSLGDFPYPDYEPMAFWGDRRQFNEILERQ